jgi:hypothetical protein
MAFRKRSRRRSGYRAKSRRSSSRRRPVRAQKIGYRM